MLHIIKIRRQVSTILPTHSQSKPFCPLHRLEGNFSLWSLLDSWFVLQHFTIIWHLHSIRKFAKQLHYLITILTTRITIVHLQIVAALGGLRLFNEFMTETSSKPGKHWCILQSLSAQFYACWLRSKFPVLHCSGAVCIVQLYIVESYQ